MRGPMVIEDARPTVQSFADCPDPNPSTSKGKSGLFICLWSHSCSLTPEDNPETRAHLTASNVRRCARDRILGAAAGRHPKP